MILHHVHLFRDATGIDFAGVEFTGDSIYGGTIRNKDITRMNWIVYSFDLKEIDCF